ncbi:hypothetical protein [Humibacillus xanthopallidus]|uniref:Uncharacterized protein n=1 Tax=Humibacillus xanthopallidus TaxID=412689 RepID=A0A543I354_9MICO|nr:hypothetical protein [Humibacillus xanthopallidus]TQM65026.1 hypothetical protein FBY41_1408 [Humibacillus xanthopallidus]
MSHELSSPAEARPVVLHAARRPRFVSVVAALSVALATALTTATTSQATVQADPVRGASTPIPWSDLKDPAAVRAPGVVVDTMIPDVLGSGTPGVRVGGTYYKAPYTGVDNSRPSYRQARWQVVVLSQQNLKLRWNRTYTDGGIEIDSTSTKGRAGALDKDLTALQNDPVPSLVIVTSHDTPGWVGFDPSASAVTPVLKAMGLTLSPAAAQRPGATGGFSAVVKVNGRQFTPQYKWSSISHGGRMSGLLVYDQFLNYRYVSNERPTIDTRSIETCNVAATDCRVGITVGSPRGPGAEDLQTVQTNGGAGFMVRVYDKLTLKVIDARSFSTGGNGHSLDTGMDDQARQMTVYLRSLASSTGNLAVLTSYRSPAYRNIVMSHGVTQQTMRQLSEAVATVGGSRDTFNRTVGVAGQDYTLVGWADPTLGAAMEGAGSEAAGPNARLRAVLRRDQHSLFRPVNGSAELPVEDDLATVAWSTPTGTWPALNGNVIAYLRGRQEVQDTNHSLSADPRRQYWSDVSLKSGAARDGSAMTALAAAVASVPPPAPSPRLRFTTEEFRQTQKQLHDEMVLVGHVRSNLDSLALPLDAVKGDYQNRINAIVDEIYSDAKEQKEAEFDWEGLFKALVGITAALGPGALVKAFSVSANVAEKLAHALHATAGLIEASAWGAAHSKDGPPAYDTFSLKRDEIAEHIGRRTDAAIANLTIMGDLVVADWSKLQRVGNWCFTTARPEGVCGASDERWSKLATAALKRANDRAVWTQASPLAYAAYDLGETYYPTTNPDDFTNYYYCGAFYTFNDAPEDAVAVLRRGRYLPLDGSTLDARVSLRQPDPRTQAWTLWPTSQVYVMGLKEPNSPQWSGHAYPPAEVMERMFDPVQVDGDPDQGGLGMSKTQFIPSLPHNYTILCQWKGQTDATIPMAPASPPGVP